MRRVSWRYEGVGQETQTPEGRRFVASLAFSLLILLAGIVWTMRVGQESSSLYHHLAHAEEALTGVRQVVASAPAPAKGHAQ